MSLGARTRKVFDLISLSMLTSPSIHSRAATPSFVWLCQGLVVLLTGFALAADDRRWPDFHLGGLEIFLTVKLRLLFALGILFVPRPATRGPLVGRMRLAPVPWLWRWRYHEQRMS